MQSSKNGSAHGSAPVLLGTAPDGVADYAHYCRPDTGSMIKLCAALGLASAVKIAQKKQPEIDLNQKSA
jgi:hypothetical protein